MNTSSLSDGIVTLPVLLDTGGRLVGMEFSNGIHDVTNSAIEIGCSIVSSMLNRKDPHAFNTVQVTPEQMTEIAELAEAAKVDIGFMTELVVSTGANILLETVEED